MKKCGCSLGKALPSVNSDLSEDCFSSGTRLSCMTDGYFALSFSGALRYNKNMIS